MSLNMAVDLAREALMMVLVLTLGIVFYFFIVLLSKGGTLRVAGHGSSKDRLVMDTERVSLYTFTFEASEEEDIVVDGARGIPLSGWRTDRLQTREFCFRQYYAL